MWQSKDIPCSQPSSPQNKVYRERERRRAELFFLKKILKGLKIVKGILAHISPYPKTDRISYPASKLNDTVVFGHFNFHLVKLFHFAYS